MLNKVILQGRLTKEPEIKNTANQTAVASFTIACNRSFKNEQGGYDTDFIDCVAWRQTATFVGHNFHKGDQILISGRVQTRSYENSQGSKVKVFEIIVEEVNFCGGSTAKSASAPAPQPPTNDEEDIPFEV